MPDALGAYRDAYEAAKAANESRYNQILAGYNNLAAVQSANIAGYKDYYRQIKEALANVGDSQRIQLGQEFARRGGQAQQSLVDRGLGNTTVLDAATRGVGYDQAIANIALMDALSREKADYTSREAEGVARERQYYNKILGDQLGFMERRTDAYPDIGPYLALAQAANGYAGAPGGGGFVSGGMGGGGGARGGGLGAGGGGGGYRVTRGVNYQPTFSAYGPGLATPVSYEEYMPINQGYSGDLLGAIAGAASTMGQRIDFSNMGDNPYAPYYPSPSESFGYNADVGYA